jgi:hypothetical protein
MLLGTGISQELNLFLFPSGATGTPVSCFPLPISPCPPAEAVGTLFCTQVLFLNVCWCQFQPTTQSD